MKNKQGQKYFAEFLKSEYSDENILFWQACEELKREKNTEKIEEKVRKGKIDENIIIKYYAIHTKNWENIFSSTVH